MKLIRVQCSSLGYSAAQEGAAQLNKIQCSSVGCSLAQWKDIRPWRPEFGPEGKVLFLEIVYFLFWGDE